MSTNGFPPSAPTWQLCKPVSMFVNSLFHLLILLSCLNTFVAFVVAVVAVAAVVSNNEIGEWCLRARRVPID